MHKSRACPCVNPTVYFSRNPAGRFDGDYRGAVEAAPAKKSAKKSKKSKAAK